MQLFLLFKETMNPDCSWHRRIEHASKVWKSSISISCIIKFSVIGCVEVIVGLLVVVRVKRDKAVIAAECALRPP